MSELAVRTATLPAELEQVLIQGDLSKLQPSDRVRYYRAVCESVGLNPLTKPFDYITLNGKLTLYAKKDCTDQLRSIHNISITIPAREIHDGIYVVTARATRVDGRTDESTGAVPIDKLQGDAKANAIMKCETKAKRRVTLSICGLGLLDESELETVHETRTEEPVSMIETYPPPGAYANVSPERKVPTVTPISANPEPKVEPNQTENIPEDVTAMWTRMQSIKSICDEFLVLKSSLQGLTNEERGAAIYYEILTAHGVEHANAFKSITKARKCARVMWERIQELLKGSQAFDASARI